MINLNEIWELWERTKLEVLLGFPRSPRSIWLTKARALFVRRLALLVGG